MEETSLSAEKVNESIKNMMEASFNVFSKASKDGKVLVVTGNHDSEPSTFSDTLEINSNDYSSYVKNALGEPISALYLHDLGEEFTFPFDEQICYRYKIGEFEFLCVNTPNGDRRSIKQFGHNGLYIEQIEWVEKQLAEIGTEQTVFLLCHFKVEDIETVTGLDTRADTSPDNPALLKMQSLMEKYSNVVYCYGHVHSEMHEVFENSEESVAPIVDDVATSALGCHMGSLGFYKDHYNEGNLGKEDPKVIQVMLIYVYSDRLVFEVHNTGEMPSYDGEYELNPFTVSRDMSSQFSKKISLFEKIFG